MVTRIGIIGDIHSEDELLAATLDFLRQQPGLNALLCVGDVVTGPGDAGRCCRLLREAGVRTVRGNHDRWFLNQVRGLGGYLHLPRATADDEVTGDDRAFLESLPVTHCVETPHGCLLLCHGLGDDDNSGVYSGDSGPALEGNHRLHALVGAGDFRFIVNGHTHDRMARTFDTLTIINAGTLRRDKNPCFAIADFTENRVQFYDMEPDTRAITPSEMFAL